MAHKVRVVFDTNIYISAIIFGGNPRQCLELARGREIELFSSKPILLELSQKLQKKFKWNKMETEEVIQGLIVFVKLVNQKIKVDLIKEKADYVVSGDKKHLLSLKRFKNIPIISSKEFLDMFFRKN